MSNKNALREELAALSHRQWSGWMDYMFASCDENLEDGSIYIPSELVERWKRQARTPYEELSEEEKDSDRAEADRVLETMTRLTWFWIRCTGSETTQ